MGVFCATAENSGLLKRTAVKLNAVRTTSGGLKSTAVKLKAVPTTSGCLKKERRLENVAIANALQLEAARRRSVPLRFNFVARAKFDVAQPIRGRLY